MLDRYLLPPFIYSRIAQLGGDQVLMNLISYAASNLKSIKL